jgi:hypothetical protein
VTRKIALYGVTLAARGVRAGNTLAWYVSWRLQRT